MGSSTQKAAEAKAREVAARPGAVAPVKPANRWRPWPYDRRIQFFTLMAGLPAVVTCLVLLSTGRLVTGGTKEPDALENDGEQQVRVVPYSAKVQWTFGVLVVGVWLGCAATVRERVIYPMQTLTNLLSALREGDYSLRSRRARRDDALGEVMGEINALGQTLVDRRRTAQEATALLSAVMAGIDVAVFTFDDANRLRQVNHAGTLLLGQTDAELVGRSAEELALTPALAGKTTGRSTPTSQGAKGRAGASIDPASGKTAGRTSCSCWRMSAPTCGKKNAPPGNGSSGCWGTKSTTRWHRSPPSRTACNPC